LNPSVDPRTLQLFAGGVEQAIRVTGEADGRFDAGDAIEFYGTGTDTPFTDTRTYWLVSGDRNAHRIQPRRPVVPEGPAPPASGRRSDAKTAASTLPLS